MSNYLLAFRGRLDADSPAAQEAVWAKWFQDLGPAILDTGHRVGRFTTVGSRGVVADGAGTDPLTVTSCSRLTAWIPRPSWLRAARFCREAAKSRSVRRSTDA